MIRNLVILLAVVGLLAGATLAQTATTAPANSGEKTYKATEESPAKAPAGGTVQSSGTGSANGATTKPAAGSGQPQEEGIQRFMPFIIIMAGFIILYMFMGRSRRKQEAQRKKMLSELKKGDKITTIGGVIGTVIEVRDDEVMIKVDESNNTRMRFARWAIRGVGEAAKTETPEDKK